MAKRSRKPIARQAIPSNIPESDLVLRKRCDGRIIGMRTNRYSWWCHWRELADFELPRRYRWLVTPNMQSRGSPINQHILDSTGTLAARNLASGIMTGVTDPTKLWFRLRLGQFDSTQTSPISLWLAEVERIMMMVFHESNFYTSIATVWFDLVVFGTALMLIYEDFENVIHCETPCLGEFYLANDADNEPSVSAREFTFTVEQTVEEFGLENCSPDVQQAWTEGDGASLSREIVIAHLIEPNTDAAKYGFASSFRYREMYWQWGGSASGQGSSSAYQGFLRKRGFNEAPNIAFLWDTVSNDPYGRSPGMDALPDIKQLQLETRRKAQGIDKQVNPPMLADIQLKNQPASLLPGGITYMSGMMSATNRFAGFRPVYEVKPDLAAMTADLQEVRERIGKTFFNDLFRTASQYETRSNVTAVEWDMRKAESLVMLGPVLERIQTQLARIIDRTFAIAARAGIIPPAPTQVQGLHMRIEFDSMLAQAQAAVKTGGIERVLGLAGNLAGIDPAAIDNIDIDYALDKMSTLLNNDPRMIRSPDQLIQIRQMRAQQQQQAAQAEQADKLAKSAKVLSETQLGQGQTALQVMTGL